MHAFWYCTDNISKWPDNETFCRELFATCEENLPAPIQGKYKNFATTSTTEASQTTESTTTTIGILDNLDDNMKNQQGIPFIFRNYYNTYHHLRSLL